MDSKVKFVDKMFHIVNFTNDLFHVKGCGQRLESEKKTALCFDIPNDLFIVALNWHACLTGCRQTKEKKELFLSHLAVCIFKIIRQCFLSNWPIIGRSGFITESKIHLKFGCV